MDTALPQIFPFILDRNLEKANWKGNHVCTSCDTVVLVYYINNLFHVICNYMKLRAYIAVIHKLFIPHYFEASWNCKYLQVRIHTKYNIWICSNVHKYKAPDKERRPWGSQRCTGCCPTPRPIPLESGSRSTRSAGPPSSAAPRAGTGSWRQSTSGSTDTGPRTRRG